MSDPKEIDTDLRDFLSKLPNLRNEDKLNYLRAIFDKHFTFTKLDHMINRGDIREIVSTSKANYVRLSPTTLITGQEIESGEFPAVATIEALLTYLTKNNLLKKLVHVDFNT